MAETQEIKITKHSWSSEVKGALVVSLGEDSEFFKCQVLQGVAECWRFENEEVDIWTIVRREDSELVVCCLEGIGARKAVPLIEQAAKKAGCKTIRAHTKRKALARMFNEYELAEYVYRKVL